MDSVVLRDSITNTMSNKDFYRFCSENPDLRIERNSNLEVVIMSPVSSQFSHYNNVISSQLYLWSIKDGHGISFDSSAGFTLPDRSVLSPDASWVSRECWNKLTKEDQERFAPICPEFIIEVRSKSDSFDDLKNKMRLWIKNGAQLAWLIDPIEVAITIFKPDGSESKIDGFQKPVHGENIMNGFVLDLSKLLE